MKYMWDEKKARSNYAKHGISFEEAQVIWTDPFSLEYYDQTEGSETRFLRVGLNPFRGILLVVFCEIDDEILIRIISARKATSLERLIYEKELRS